MLYRTFGKTGYRISQLGFGAMRLPKVDRTTLDMDKAVEVLRHALDLGVNYIDTAAIYGRGQSEEAIGRAVAGRREDVYISTKIPVHMERFEIPRWRELVEKQLTLLQTDYIDFWYFHDLQDADYTEKVMPKGGLMELMQKLRDEGLIRHICVSVHEKPEVVKKYIDSGCFEGLIIQYNLLNRANEEVIAYAHDAGLGVTIMGPVGGGQLAIPSQWMTELFGDAGSLAEAAIRFVLANPHVTSALSGMETVEMVNENCAAASREEPLSDSEKKQIDVTMAELKRLADLYCTGCGYCMPCPHRVDIPKNFGLTNQFKVYGFEEAARDGYRRLETKDGEGQRPRQKEHLRASECTECGECLEKCPQKIDIPAQLKETHSLLASE